MLKILFEFGCFFYAWKGGTGWCGDRQIANIFHHHKNPLYKFLVIVFRGGILLLFCGCFVCFIFMYCNKFLNGLWGRGEVTTVCQKRKLYYILNMAAFFTFRYLINCGGYIYITFRSNWKYFMISKLASKISILLARCK